MFSDPIRLPANHAIVVLDEVASTNTEAMRRAVAGETGPLWVMARRQTGGRGRSGRQWVSKAGNLHASLLMSSTCGPQQSHQLALVAGIVVYDATLKLAEVSSGGGGGGGGQQATRLPGLALKWPNDGLIGGGKFAGILSECRQAGHSSGIEGGNVAQAAIASQIVVGIGINLASAPDATGRPVTCLARHGINADPETMLALVAQGFDHWLSIWRDGQGFGQIRLAWLE